MTAIRSIVFAPVRAAWRWLRKQLLSQKSFPFLERLGVHVTAVHYHAAIPDTRTLASDIWTRRSPMNGVDLNLDRQRDMLRTFAAKYRGEYNNFPVNATLDPRQFYLHNSYFESVDAEILYCMIRQHAPRNVVEVGSGFSSLLIGTALGRNTADGGPLASYTIIDPHASDEVATALSGRVEVIRRPVEHVPISIFDSLGFNDVLFIDSTHVLRTGSDVCHEFLEILPRLAPGVLVHVHDIFLPFEYPREWVIDLHFFWNEQYLLQAFLCFNNSFEVIWAGRAMAADFPEEIRAAIGSFRESPYFPASFWIRRTR